MTLSKYLTNSCRLVILRLAIAWIGTGMDIHTFCSFEEKSICFLFEKWPKMKNKIYISQVPYLRNSIAYNHGFWYISPGVFFIFSKFWFFGLVGWKGKKWSKVTKNYVFCASFLRNHKSCDCHLWYTCVKWWNLLEFFHFFKILIFQIVRWGRGG